MSAKTQISRSKWPWGQMSPGLRIRDLEMMISRHRSQIPIVEDQAAEAIRRINLNLRALEDQVLMAQECLDEEMRSKNKDIAYALSSEGIDVIERVNTSEDQTTLNQELTDLLTEASKSRENKEDLVDDLDQFFTTSTNEL
jgi:hypothetical protein